MSTNGRYRARTAAVCAALGLLTFCGALQLPALAAEQPVIAAGSASSRRVPKSRPSVPGPTSGPTSRRDLEARRNPDAERRIPDRGEAARRRDDHDDRREHPYASGAGRRSPRCPPSPPPPLALEMPKLELMTVPSDGIPELTAEDLDKRARELAAPRPRSRPAAPRARSSRPRRLAHPDCAADIATATPESAR